MDQWGQPSEASDLADEPLDRVLLVGVCDGRRGAKHKLITVNKTASGLVARWTSRDEFETAESDHPRGYVMWERHYIGKIPKHVIATDQYGRPVMGALIGGIVSAHCRCGTYCIHTRDIEALVRANSFRPRRQVSLTGYRITRR
jgi:hypothetical protein